MEEFQINQGRFSGPYTSLLQMIEERKLSITEVCLAQIADEYIAYVKSLSEKDYLDISQFVVVATTLMLIKVKSLLPGITYTDAEETQIHELQSKLELYRVLETGVKELRKKFGKSSLYSRNRMKLKNPVFTPSSEVHVDTLHSIALLMKAAFERVEGMKKHIVKEVFKLEEMIESMTKRIMTASQMKLSEFKVSDGSIEENKKMLITSFLALLELVKSGVVHATQEDDDILLQKL